MSSHRSGSLDYTQNSGSYYSATAVRSAPLYSKIFFPQSRNDVNYTQNFGSHYSATAVRSAPLYSKIFFPRSRNDVNYAQVFDGGPSTNCSASYTYYQRVYDNINEIWCYYSGSVTNEAPGPTDTQPNNSGDISGYSIVYITDKISCT